MISALSSPASVGTLALLAALLSLPLYYFLYRRLPEPKKQRSLLKYLSTALAVGFIAFVAGMMLGILAFCSAEDAGNLCGLAGVFGTGPLLAAIAVIAYAHFWLRSARRAH